MSESQDCVARLHKAAQDVGSGAQYDWFPEPPREPLPFAKVPIEFLSELKQARMAFEHEQAERSLEIDQKWLDSIGSPLKSTDGKVIPGATFCGLGLQMQIQPDSRDRMMVYLLQDDDEIHIGQVTTRGAVLDLLKALGLTTK